MAEYPKLRCVVLQSDRDTRVCVIDHIASRDLPAAVGYYVLSFIQEMDYDSDITVSRADAPAHLLKASNVRSVNLPGEDLGMLYEAQVEIRNNERN